jgi:hypothetical protein
MFSASLPASNRNSSQRLNRSGYLTNYNSKSKSKSYFTTDNLPPISSSWREASRGSRPEIQSQSQNHTATDGQSVSQSVNLGSWPDIYYFLTVTVLFLWGALSDERTGLSFVYAAGSCQRSLPRVGVPRASRPYLPVSDQRLPCSSPPTTRRVTREVSIPPPHGDQRFLLTVLLITSRHEPRRKRIFHYCYILLLPWKHTCLRSRYLAVAVV